MSREFGKGFIKDVEKRLSAASVERMNLIGLRAHSRLVKATPVDLGQARAGWNFSLNEMDTTTPPEKTKIRAPKSRLPKPRAKKIGDSYHISNFVEHIVYLNEGTSEQAGSNFVETEVAAAFHDVERSL